jgi:hypothetical protein
LFVDLTGVEPVISAMRMRRITNCATGPSLGQNQGFSPTIFLSCVATDLPITFPLRLFIRINYTFFMERKPDFGLVWLGYEVAGGTGFGDLDSAFLLDGRFFGGVTS